MFRNDFYKSFQFDCAFQRIKKNQTRRFFRNINLNEIYVDTPDDLQILQILTKSCFFCSRLPFAKHHDG